MQTPPSTTEDEIIIESFSNPKHTWKTLNDPVMGGESYSSFTIDTTHGYGLFTGEVVDVPFLKAPGFITVRGDGNNDSGNGDDDDDGDEYLHEYPDVSSCTSLVLKAKTYETYDGYRISFGNRSVPGNRYARGYKANFHISPSSSVNEEGVTNEDGVDVDEYDDEMKEVIIPFSNFTVRWSDLTGEPITSCQENPDFCPDLQTLRNMKTISLWGEGVAGKVNLVIDSIKATGCAPGNNYLGDESQGNPSSSLSSEMFHTMGGLILMFLAIVFGGGFLITRVLLSKRLKGYKNPNKNVNLNQEGIV